MTTSSARVSKPTLLDLPYDIRYAIYEQLFPPGLQVYIHGTSCDDIKMMMPADVSIPTNLFLVCRGLQREASEYLYNRYLFNIIGTKAGCLSSYEGFQKTMQKYCRAEVSIHVFSNGDHSATSCICLQAGDSKLQVLHRRRRGQPTTMRKLEDEVSQQQLSTMQDPMIASRCLRVLLDCGHIYRIPLLVAALVAAVALFMQSAR